MATLTASSFASRSSHASYSASIGSGSKATFKKVLTITHNGLRALNKVDELHVKTKAKVLAKQAKREALESPKRRPSSLIVCGMNIIFVGTEVGPWSKTGGLGDVLGGLPPAMAVSF